jgi:hypothetical protein
MTKRTRPKWRCCPSWHELQRLFPAQEDHLNAEAVYTLPPALLDAIVREVPGFFTAEELAFEKALHKVAGAGFFRGSPINLQLLGSPQSTETADERELRQKVEAATETIEDMLFKDLSATQRADREAAAEAIKAKLQERRWGYAGWLITSPEFRTDVEKLRTEWGSEIKEHRLPQVPWSFTGAREPVPQKEREQLADFMRLYLKWGLDRLETWDLPVPMRAETASPALYSYTDVSSAGLLIFAPWYLLRDKDLNVYELAELRTVPAQTSHLRDWLDGKPKNFGHLRFAILFEMFVFLELCLRKRYAGRLLGKLAKLDRAFARYFRHDPQGHDSLSADESLRKVRQFLTKSLRKVQGTLSPS